MINKFISISKKNILKQYSSDKKRINLSSINKSNNKSNLINKYMYSNLNKKNIDINIVYFRNKQYKSKSRNRNDNNYLDYISITNTYKNKLMTKINSLIL